MIKRYFHKVLNDGPIVIFSTDVAKRSVNTTLRDNNRVLATALGMFCCWGDCLLFRKF